MKDKSKKFNELYKEYEELSFVTHSEAQIRKPGGTYKINYIKPEDLARRKALAKDIVKNYKEFFKDKPAALFEIRRNV